jgi:transposase-like protein
MKTIEFIKRYSDEASCKAHFIALRKQEGVICKKCGHSEHYWLSTIDQFKCKSCGFKTTLRSGTVMESSKLSYLYWYMAMYWMINTKKGISAKEMQRQLGHQRYEPIWFMMQKLRMMMGKREDHYLLSDAVEADEAYFVTVGEKSQETKRGRGTDKTPVLVLAESLPLKEKEKRKKHQPKRRLRYVKMRVLEDLQSDSINRELKQTVLPNAELRTDGYRSYSKTKNIIKSHKVIMDKTKEAHKLLPWVHTAIGNAKRVINGIYHRVNQAYLQNYLDEFCYRLNRRWLADPFDRLVAIIVINPWYK